MNNYDSRFLIKPRFFSLQMLIITLIGIILYGLGGLLAFTVYYNTMLKPAIAILAIWACLYGPVVGFIVGVLGHILTDIFSSSGVWWTWAFGSGLVGIVIGLYPVITRDSIKEGIFRAEEVIILIVLSLVSNFFGYLISAILDIFLYEEPLNKVITQQLIVAISNTVLIGILSSSVLKLFADIVKNKKGE